MDGDLDAALSFDRRLRERAAATVRRLPGATVVRHDGLADVHYLNALLLHGATSAGPVDAAAVVALTNAELAGCPDRHVVVDDAATGEAVAADLVDAGWERERTLYMAFGADADALAADPRVRELSAAEARALEAASLAEDVPASAIASGRLDRLIATAGRRRMTSAGRSFGAPDGGELASMGTLFVDIIDGRRVAMIDGVGTRVGHRERGLARAVVSAATAAALSWGAELVLVPADADDWPQLIYARLGFAPLGVQVALTGSGPGAV